MRWPPPGNWPATCAVVTAIAWSGALGLAWLTPAVAQVEQETEIRDFAVHLRFDYTVEVTRETLLWPAGSRLQPGRPLYSHAGGPHLLVEITALAEPDAMADLHGRLHLSAVLRASSLTGESLWESPVAGPEQIPMQVTNGDAGPGPPAGRAMRASARLPLNMEELRRQVQQIGDETGFLHQVHHQVVIQARAEISGRTGDRARDVTVSGTMPVRFEAQGFAVPPPERLAVLQDVIYRQAEPVVRHISWRRRLGEQWPLLGVGFLSLCLAAGIRVMQRRAPAGSGPERSAEHRRFKPWITEGQIRSEAELAIDVSSLEGLVDLAIDMKKRVIFDRNLRSYHVLDEDTRYTYRPLAAKRQARQEAEPLGQILLRSGVIDQGELEQGLQYQRTIERPLGECLIAKGYLDEVTLFTALASQMGLPYLELDPDSLLPEPSLLAELSETWARVFLTVPVGLRPDGMLALAITNPFDKGVTATAQHTLGRPVFPVLARPGAVRLAIDTITRARAGLFDRTALAAADEMNPQVGPDDLRYGRTRPRPYVPPLGIVLKAAGYLSGEPTVPLTAPDQLVRRALAGAGVHPDAIQLAAGGQMLYRDCTGRRGTPLTLLELLHRANRLPHSQKEWCEERLKEENSTAESVLTGYYLASPATLQRAARILAAVKRLLALTGL